MVRENLMEICGRGDLSAGVCWRAPWRRCRILMDCLVSLENAKKTAAPALAEAANNNWNVAG